MRIAVLLCTGLLTCACMLPGLILSPLAQAPEPGIPAPPLTPTSQPTAFVTAPAPIATPTLLPATPTQQIYYGRVYFDQNGNGMREDSEPGIGGLTVCLEREAVRSCAVSLAQGEFAIAGDLAGEVKLTLSQPGVLPAERFRYTSRFQDWVEIPAYRMHGVAVPDQTLPGVRIHPMETSLIVQVAPDAQLEIGVMQGILTDIFSCADRQKITKFHGYDLDDQKGSVRNYLGETYPLNHGSEGPGGTEDNHFAVDWGGRFRSLIGTPVRAAAPGIVTFAGNYTTNQGVCQVVELAHPDAGLITGYVHLDTILVRDRQPVARGQVIGTLGISCTTWPHVHFYLRVPETQTVNTWRGIDPFRDTLDAESISWWSVDNQPVCSD